MNDQDQERFNEDEEEGDDPELALPAIESLDDYVRRYGLLAANEDDQAGGEFNGLNRLEAIKRIRDEEAYRDEVIEKYQSSQHEGLSQQRHDSSPSLEKERTGVISLLLANKTTYEIPVQPLVAFCDTVERMVHSRDRYGIRGRGKISHRATNPFLEEGENNDCPIIEISLVEFDADATMAFIGVLLMLHDHKQKGFIPARNDGSSEISRKQRINDEVDDDFSDACREALIREEKIPGKHVVECLKLAHYLQCRVILETLTSILELSIDSRNCMAICSLADSLNLKSLFEASVNYVIERLDALQGTADPQGGSETKSSLSNDDDHDAEGESNELWTSLPFELRCRILTMRNVMRSSVIGRGSKVSGLFFSSGAEFLAIFRETIRDQKERLAEAKERSEELVRERTEQWVARSQRRGWLFDKSSDAKMDFIHSSDLRYSFEKIEMQSRRLRTLEKFYEEQKAIFDDGNWASEIVL
ncbi:hypothetical protein ACHAXA_003706 [Cyclostephanos tholiformis]|uniref:Uncharacterized protein n=1 Tax=Cyclostephanos tholiformis TaxID=382380 RepID=A0ABD3RZ91_9STRA